MSSNTVMKNNMYPLVVFLVLISSVSSILSVDDQDIFMVVEDPTSLHHAGMEMTKLEIGKFVLEDGKVLTLSRKSSPSRNCVGLNQQCGALDWCCDPYNCIGLIPFLSGVCRRPAFA
ncbi:hypothetical protein Tco_0743529 [Tanacetum coccineum]